MTSQDPVGASESEPDELAPIRAMITTLEPLALAELERALRLTLSPPETPAERRVAELGLLARLLDEHPDARRRQFVARSLYDERRHADASKSPDSKRLVERYGSWQRLCRAPSSIRPDGRLHGKHLAYNNETRGRRRTSPYTRDEAQKAIPRCALELGRVPSSTVYQRWVTDVKRASRKAGVELPRLPDLRTVYRFYKQWKRAIAAAQITAAEVAHARVERVLRLAHLEVLPAGPLEAFAAADPKALAQIGIDSTRRTYLTTFGLTQLSLSEALKVSRLLGGSLDWLGGIDPARGGPPQDSLVFDPTTINTLLEQADINVTELRRRLELSLGSWRRLRNGKREPLLYELAVIACLGKQPIVALLKTR